MPTERITIDHIAAFTDSVVCGCVFARQKATEREYLLHNVALIGMEGGWPPHHIYGECISLMNEIQRRLVADNSHIPQSDLFYSLSLSLSHLVALLSAAGYARNNSSPTYRNIKLEHLAYMWPPGICDRPTSDSALNSRCYALNYHRASRIKKSCSKMLEMFRLRMSAIANKC